MKRAILEALRARYEAEIAEADATANIFLDHSEFSLLPRMHWHLEISVAYLTHW